MKGKWLCLKCSTPLLVEGKGFLQCPNPECGIRHYLGRDGRLYITEKPKERK